MDSSAIGELNSIKSELRSIITEMESIASGVRSEFTGIGNERCAQSIESVISKYYGVLRILNNIDTSI